MSDVANVLSLQAFLPPEQNSAESMTGLRNKTVWNKTIEARRLCNTTRTMFTQCTLSD